MTKMLLRYVQEFKDRHGQTRRYFRRPGHKRVKLLGAPGSDEFMAGYRAALSTETAPRLDIGASKVIEGTIDDLVVRYLRSSEFAGLATSTQAAYRNILARFRADHGTKRVAKLERQHVKDIIARKGNTPAAANRLLKILRPLMAIAMEAGMRRDDPTIGVKGYRIKSDGHPIWSEEHIKAFRDRHPLGTRARLAMELAYATMQRRGDLVRLGRQNIHNGTLSLRQQKTGNAVAIPVLPELQAVLDLLPAGQMIFVMTGPGKPFTAAGFGNWFRDRCTEAGLPKRYNAHGLRKAGATRGAEAGWTDHEIMAWGGWSSISEVQRYTKAANRRKLAASAVHKLGT